MAVYELSDFDMPKQPSPPPESQMDKLQRQLRWVQHEQANGVCAGIYARKLKADHARLTAEIARLRVAQSDEPAAQPAAPSAERSAFSAAVAAPPAAVEATPVFPPGRNTRIAINKVLKSLL